MSHDEFPEKRPYSPDDLRQILDWVRTHNDAWEFKGERGVQLRAIFARATGTAGAAVSLTDGDYGAQAIMLCRPIFEDLVLACWIKWLVHPNFVTTRLRDQERHSVLVWNKIADKHPSVRRRPLQYDATPAEHDRYRAWFGDWGQIPWWEVGEIDLRSSPRSEQSRFRAVGRRRKLRTIIDELQANAWPISHRIDVLLPGPPEIIVNRLNYLYDVVNRTNNEMLHYTAGSSSLTYDYQTHRWRDGPLKEAVQTALSSLMMTYDKLIFVMLQHGKGHPGIEYYEHFGLDSKQAKLDGDLPAVDYNHLEHDYLKLRTRLGI
jgi:hypothetical protein